MNPVEQTALLFRQTAALHRHGRSHLEALTAARAGLPPGPIADRVDRALRTLASGEEGTPTGDALDAVLAGQGDSVDHLDHAAAALDTQLAAEASLNLGRLYLTVLVALPLLVGAAVGWVEPARLTEGDLEGTWTLFTTGTGVLKWLGVPLALGWAAFVRMLPTLSVPGRDHLRRASGLLQGAAEGRVSVALMGSPTELRYFDARRPACGEVQAAVEIAEELILVGHARVHLFRHLAPLVLAMVFFLMSWVTLTLLTVPLASGWGDWFMF
ncbi:MAG: hypothetical protein GY898_30090 [Proteobacteria bacterium]|nr:hypothetical protein [Pseudomonadota bacterium]